MRVSQSLNSSSSHPEPQEHRQDQPTSTTSRERSASRSANSATNELIKEVYDKSDEKLKTQMSTASSSPSLSSQTLADRLGGPDVNHSAVSTLFVVQMAIHRQKLQIRDMKAALKAAKNENTSLSEQLDSSAHERRQTEIEVLRLQEEKDES